MLGHALPTLIPIYWPRIPRRSSRPGPLAAASPPRPWPTLLVDELRYRLGKTAPVWNRADSWLPNNNGPACKQPQLPKERHKADEAILKRAVKGAVRQAGIAKHSPCHTSPFVRLPSA